MVARHAATVLLVALMPVLTADAAEATAALAARRALRRSSASAKLGGFAGDEVPEGPPEDADVARYGPDGCVSAWRSAASHCVIRTDCSGLTESMANFSVSFLCVDATGESSRHSFGAGAFGAQDTFDTLISCSSCAGVDDDVPAAPSAGATAGRGGAFLGLAAAAAAKIVPPAGTPGGPPAPVEPAAPSPPPPHMTVDAPTGISLEVLPRMQSESQMLTRWGAKKQEYEVTNRRLGRVFEQAKALKQNLTAAEVQIQFLLAKVTEKEPSGLRDADAKMSRFAFEIVNPFDQQAVPGTPSPPPPPQHGPWALVAHASERRNHRQQRHHRSGAGERRTRRAQRQMHLRRHRFHGHSSVNSAPGGPHADAEDDAEEAAPEWQPWAKEVPVSELVDQWGEQALVGAREPETYRQTDELVADALGLSSQEQEDQAELAGDPGDAEDLQADERDADEREGRGELW